VTTASGHTVTAAHVVHATNVPNNNRFVIHTKQMAYRTYVIAAPLERLPDETFLLWETGWPYQYMRFHHDLERDIHWVIVGGQDHRTGQASDFAERYQALEDWTRRRFPTMGPIKYRWSGQVMEPVDFLGYIGRNPHDDSNVYIVTGDSGNGLTHGTLGGQLIVDLIAGRANAWEDLYDPHRIKLNALPHFLAENLNVAYQYRDWLKPDSVSAADKLAPGTGAVIHHGTTCVATYRDLEGTLHERSAVCPHLAGRVRWNAAEKTWDCPCHGSRFDRYGRLINGPATTDLDPVHTHVPRHEPLVTDVDRHIPP
jgi:nitrite reductase/ring-hydroxylating ferredoxin subunit